MIDKCNLCGGRLGQDITDRPMCYWCGPMGMMPPTPEALQIRMERASRQMVESVCARYGEPAGGQIMGLSGFLENVHRAGDGGQT